MQCECSCQVPRVVQSEERGGVRVVQCAGPPRSPLLHCPCSLSSCILFLSPLHSVVQPAPPAVCHPSL